MSFGKPGDVGITLRLATVVATATKDQTGDQEVSGKTVFLSYSPGLLFDLAAKRA
jgi:hypothetical protein